MVRDFRYADVSEYLDTFSRLDSFSRRVTGFRAARLFFTDWLLFSDPTLEHLWVAHFDPLGRCIHFNQTDGDAIGVDLPIADIVADTIACRAVGVVIAHNHPSGDARPSESDCRFTRKLGTVLDGLDCRLLDHLIFAGCDCTSFRAAGLL